LFFSIGLDCDRERNRRRPRFPGDAPRPRASTHEQDQTACQCEKSVGIVMAEQVPRHSAEDPFAQAQVAVATHDDQVGPDLGRARQELLADTDEVDLAAGFAGDTVRLEPRRGQVE
jgi:hypothetical protein